MGSASMAGGFGKRVPSNPAFQHSRNMQRSNAIDGRQSEGEPFAHATGPGVIFPAQARIQHGICEEVAEQFYEQFPDGKPLATWVAPDYASFRLRVLALGIDLSFLIVILMIIGKVILVTGLATLPVEALEFGIAPDSIAGALIAANQSDLFWLTPSLIIVYFALLESSPMQGTLGKFALGLRVEDENGNKIGPGRAICRIFARAFSAMTLCIGYVMAAFNQQKKALHDMVCATCVVK